jgi:mono/diheme cytochrome c family protein
MARARIALAAIAVITAALAGPALAASLPGKVKMPDLSVVAALGQTAFAEHCATCHGADTGGTNSGPSLVDPLYQPDRLSDSEIEHAILEGAPELHWHFGAMRPVGGVSETEIAQIIVFIREVQRANGIY